MKTKTQPWIAGSTTLLLGFACLSAASLDEWRVPSRENQRKNPISADAKSIEAGKAIYAQNCVACHGSSGKGDGPKGRDLEPQPTNLCSPPITAESDGSLHWKISTGRRPMPSFEKMLSNEERWQVINYIRTLAPATISAK